jgi:hypothetical protein
MVCLYAECRYAECRYAECIGAASEYLSIEQTKDFLQVYQARPVIKIFNWFELVLTKTQSFKTSLLQLTLLNNKLVCLIHLVTSVQVWYLTVRLEAPKMDHI